MLVSPTYKLGGIEIPMYPGDLLNLNEVVQTIALDAAYTYLGPDLTAGDVYRTLMSVGRIDVFPTAQQIIDALRSNINSVTPPNNELYGIQPSRSVNLAWPNNLLPFNPGSTFRRRITATTAFALTMAVQANTGVSLSAAPYDQTIIAASSWRDFLIQINNSSPSVIISVNQVNAALLVTVPSGYLDLINGITPGMSVFGANIAAGTTVRSVNRDTGIITLSAAVTATLNNNAVTFTPTVTIYGLGGGAR